MKAEKLFWELYRAETEKDVDRIISNHQEIFSQENWKPYGDEPNNFGVIENQQDNPIAALIEKITNSIDAILMKRCYEEGIDPRSEAAPQLIDEAINRFFPNSANWDLSPSQYKQAEDIQIIAHGPRQDTSLVIYDDGEGQEPDNFGNTLLSLLRGNKNDIPFVQGKYNMGGSGAIVFCGKKRYQLVASKRFDGGSFGFSIVRKHPFSQSEISKYKSTWYEYFTIENQIPRFDIGELDLGLRGKQFRTGTLLKLYSYQLPPRSRSVISRDLNQSINEYLFEPALPVFTIDNNERYPKDVNPERSLYGLKRRLDDSKYVYKHFSEEVSDWGGFKITCYVFKFKVDDKGNKETIRREFFKNNMSVLFSVNGQVHGHYTHEFISRSLKFNLLKEHLLIHIDCSKLDPDFRGELFMASRDRMKHGKESSKLRDRVAKILKRSQLKEIYNDFKSKITSGDGDDKKILKDFSKNLPLNPDLTKLLKRTLNLDNITKSKGRQDRESKKHSSKKEHSSFDGKRFPSSFSINAQQKGDELPIIQIPKGSTSIIKFNTDVDDEYFDRIEDPGELEIALLDYKKNRGEGKGKPQPEDISELLSMAKSSPNKGTIRLHTKARDEVEIGDSIKIQATLTNPVDDDLTQIFWVKVMDIPNESKKPKKEKSEDLGLPTLIQVKENRSEYRADGKTWGDMEGVSEFNANTIVYSLVGGDKLEAIYINMDSNVLKRFIAKQGNEEQINIARNRYLSSVYFHTLFLYMVSKNKKYEIKQEESGDPTELQEYIADIFENYYAEFLLNFETSQLLEALSD